MRHSEAGSSDKTDGSVHAFNVIAVVLNLLKLPSVVGVFVSYYVLMSHVLPDTLGSNPVVKQCLAALLTWLIGIWSITLLLSFATVSGFASFQSGATGYYREYSLNLELFINPSRVFRFNTYS